MERSRNRLREERIDTAPTTVRSMSYNVPGHEDRLKALCERVQLEYFDLKDKKGRLINNPQKKSDEEFVRWYDRFKKPT